MFTEKEINVVKALVEEEVIVSTSCVADEHLSSIYCTTLNGIVKKLSRMGSFCPSNYSQS